MPSATVTVRVEAGGLSRLAADLRDYCASSAGGALVAGIGVETCVKRHVARLSSTRHACATRLGARPTGHWDASLVELTGAAGGAATVRVAIRGAARAWRDMVLRPRESQYLAIPVHALAYGVRPKELRERMDTFIPKKADRPAGTSAVIFGRIHTAKGRGKNRRTVEEVVPLYILKKTVRQSRDPSLMPTDDELKAAAARAVAADLRTRSFQ